MSVKARFIAQTLEKAGADMMVRQGSAIATSTGERSGRLLSERSIEVATGDAAASTTVSSSACTPPSPPASCTDLPRKSSTKSNAPGRRKNRKICRYRFCYLYLQKR